MGQDPIAPDRLPPQVAVVGGGWAGLACAVELCRNGIDVTLFEASRTFGGRARSVPWTLASGKTIQIDNGQHILIGAYRETLASMRALGVDPETCLARLPLTMADSRGFRFRAGERRAPFHLVAGLIGARGLTFHEKFRMAVLMGRARGNGWNLAEDITVFQWLQDNRQPMALIRRFWAPLCVAALNTRAEHASARIFLNVLRDSLGQARDASDFLLPRGALGTLLPEAAITYLEQHAKLRSGIRVHEIEESAHGLRVETRSTQVENEAEVFSGVVIATPAHQVTSLCGPVLSRTLSASLAACAGLTWQPIATIYLLYPESVGLPAPMIALIDDAENSAYGQWVFDKGQLGGARGLLAVVISADGPHMSLDHEELARVIHLQLAVELDIHERPLEFRVIVEKRATFACIPNLTRPENCTAHPNVMLAGDASFADYPATLEGAIRSGIDCARLLRDRLSNSTMCA